ncbi:MAG: zinc-ribbon domain-containing protein [Roseburia sp.]|nr:zinc-ribbon domain-containing protein [Roseburia sp.]
MKLFDLKGKDEILDKIQRATSELFASSELEKDYIQSENKTKFCSNCGAKLDMGEKFCHNCGKQLVNNTHAESTESTENSFDSSQRIVEPTLRENPTQRKQEFVGKIQKCPNCGCTITDIMVVCPDCGMQITGRTANLSVQEFKEQLLAIERSRKGGLGSVFRSNLNVAPDKADMQKLALIRNFPVPNSIGDVLEFMMLAIANIDVKLSKNTFVNRCSNNETAATINRAISNAWVSKMEQVYRKAEILFPNDPAFEGIQKLYFDKMKELKIKIIH